jgi:poly-gamma-glutamate synthesis protein (capsule biosynthesis protein)
LCCQFRHPFRVLFAEGRQALNADGFPRERITAVLEAAAAEKPDITIALLHWGSEYNDTHSKTQGDIANLMFSLGVDAIIGTHPHYVQEMQFNAEKGTFLAYSLGDLLGDGTKSGTEYSVVLELEITKNNTTGETKITGYKYTPIFIYENDDGQMRVVRMEEAMDAYERNFPSKVSKEVYDDMTYAAGRIEARIHPKEEEKK